MAATKRDTHPIDMMLAISDVLTHRRLAQLYTRVRERDTATIDELAYVNPIVSNTIDIVQRYIATATERDADTVKRPTLQLVASQHSY